MIDLAPTRSSGLFVQKVGRITRAYYAQGYDLSTVEGRLQAISNGKKQVAVLLDYAGNTMANGKINQPRIPKKKGESDGTGDAPIKACPKCLALIYASARVCNTFNPFTGELCDFEFEFKTRLQTSASSDSVVARDEPPIKEWIDVKSVAYSTMKSKKDNIPMLVVSYSGFIKTYKEYICLEHTGFAGSQARKWWRMRTNGWGESTNNTHTPETINEALTITRRLAIPTQIYVHMNAGKYPKIENYNFDKTKIS
jgi:DNA repair protein RadD